MIYWKHLSGAYCEPGAFGARETNMTKTSRLADGLVAGMG